MVDVTSHGTLAGYRAHRLHATSPCDPCRRAYERLYGPDEPRHDGELPPAFDPKTRLVGWHETELKSTDRALTRARKADPQTRPECGTTAGYNRHRRMRENPCDPCRQANNVHRAGCGT